MRLAIVVLLGIAGVAHADGTDRPNALYLEGLGKGGPWGLGYERLMTSRLSLGVVVSFAPLDGQRLYSFAPYIGAYVLGRGHHHWFVDGGPQLDYLVTPSPVPEWRGMTKTGIGGELSTGYEYRDHFLFRVYGEITGSSTGFAPWGGISIGWTF